MLMFDGTIFIMAYSFEEKTIVFPWYGNYLRDSIVQRLRLILDFIMFSSSYVAIAAVGLAYTSCFIQSIPWEGTILLIMALVSFSVYNLNRKTDEEEDEINHQDRFIFTKKFEKHLFCAAILAYGLALAIAAYYGIIVFGIVLIPLISGILYSVPLLPASWRYRRLKEIPAFKNLVVAFAWALPLSLLPVFITGAEITTSTAVAAILFISYFIFASVLPDIRDREGDAATGVRTIPVVIGVERTKALLVGLNLILGGGVIAIWFSKLSFPVTIILLTAVLYSHFCICSLGKLIRTDIVCDFLADGQFIIFGGGIAFLTTISGIL
jgi:4-hydroxybenzoate polyprenyltransferase